MIYYLYCVTQVLQIYTIAFKYFWILILPPPHLLYYFNAMKCSLNTK